MINVVVGREEGEVFEEGGRQLNLAGWVIYLPDWKTGIFYPVMTGWMLEWCHLFMLETSRNDYLWLEMCACGQKRQLSFLLFTFLLLGTSFGEVLLCVDLGDAFLFFCIYFRIFSLCLCFCCSLVKCIFFIIC